MKGLKFDCPLCAKPLEVSEKLFGQAIECPICGGDITLPRPPAATAKKADQDSAWVAKIAEEATAITITEVNRAAARDCPECGNPHKAGVACRRTNESGHESFEVAPNEKEQPDEVLKTARGILRKSSPDIAGIAIWDSAEIAGKKLVETTIGIITGVMLGGIIGGIIGSHLANVDEHAIGILTVDENYLWIVQYKGTLSGCSPVAWQVLETIKDSSVHQTKLSEIRAEVSFFEAFNLLTVAGAIRCSAVFPSSCGSDNPDKAGKIAWRIQSHNRVKV